MNDKSKNIIIGLLVVIIVFLSIFVLLIVSGYVNFNDVEVNDDISSKEVIEKSNDNYLNLLINKCENGCNNEIYKNNEKVNFYVDSSSIKLNDQEIFKLEEGPNTLIQVSVYNDIIITLKSESLSVLMEIYDFSGNIIKTFSRIVDEKGRVFNVYPGYSTAEEFNISTDGVINFVGTKHLQGAANSYIDNTGSTIDLCDQASNIDDDEIVSGLFSFKYLGNYSFSSVNYVSTKSVVKDIK